MKIKGPLIPAVFLDRPNRFLTIISIDGINYKSHLPDPGRLKELLEVGVKIYVRPEPRSSLRKTRFTTVFVEKNGQLISLVSTLPNVFVKDALINKQLSMYKDFKLIRPEIKIKNHRIDFLLEDKKGDPFYLEVKSVSFVENGIAKFPDSVTRRGMLHLRLLKSLTLKGYNTGVLFVCQRSDAFSFQPMWDRDLDFSSALLDAFNHGVKVNCITLNISKSKITFNSEIPLNLENRD